MLTTKIIKEHNKNIDESLTKLRDFYSFNDYLARFPLMRIMISSLTEENFGYINTLRSVFAPKKQFVTTVNKLTGEYNFISFRLDKINRELNPIIFCEKELSSRVKDIKEQYSKLEQICKCVSKPENYRRCLELEKLKEEFLCDLTAMRTISDNNHYRCEVPDTERRAYAKLRLKEIEKEIKNIPNYDYNLKLNSLLSCRDHFADLCSISKISDTEYRIRDMKEKLTRQKNAFTEIGDVLTEAIGIEKVLIKQGKINIKDGELKQLRSQIIDDTNYRANKREVSIYLGDYGLYDLKNLQTKVNDYIDYFGVAGVKKNDISKFENENIEKQSSDKIM